MAARVVFPKTLKELRFLHCQTSEHSNAVRSFLSQSYPSIKKQNPHFPILIREALGIEPRIYARYEYGREKVVELKGLSDKDIGNKVLELAKDA